MAAKSAGVLVYRRRAGDIEVLLVHPGGPFWARRDAGAWSIPKGEYSDSEDAEVAARREFVEETGWTIDGELKPLGEIRQKAGKAVTAFAAEGDFDPANLKSNSFDMEWPPKSGRVASFPEVDRAGWFGLAEAREKIIEGQRSLLDRLETLVAGGG
jgi:predicted NUDIX family NTP pyrophosphohydrolase